MKKRVVILSLVLLTLSLVLYSCATVGIEKVHYTVLDDKEKPFEIRQYDPYIVAETVVDSNFKEAGNMAFRRLYNYITGENRTQQSIAMTAPVNQQTTSEKIAMTAPVNQQAVEGKYAVSFVMPSKFTMQTLPQPLDPSVVIKQVPGYKAAAIRYSGTWSVKQYNTKKQALEAFISNRNLKPAGEPIWARYDPPFQLWFLRRNEVIIPIEQPADKNKTPPDK